MVWGEDCRGLRGAPIFATALATLTVLKVRSMVFILVPYHERSLVTRYRGGFLRAWRAHPCSLSKQVCFAIDFFDFSRHAFRFHTFLHEIPVSSTTIAGIAVATNGQAQAVRISRELQQIDTVTQQNTFAMEINDISNALEKLIGKFRLQST